MNRQKYLLITEMQCANCTLYSSKDCVNEIKKVFFGVGGGGDNYSKCN